MKKTILIMAALMFFSSMSTCVFAAGGKNREQHKGNKGQGQVKQHQVKVNK